MYALPCPALPCPALPCPALPRPAPPRPAPPRPAPPCPCPCPCPWPWPCCRVALFPMLTCPSVSLQGVDNALPGASPVASPAPAGNSPVASPSPSASTSSPQPGQVCYPISACPKKLNSLPSDLLKQLDLRKLLTSPPLSNCPLGSTACTSHQYAVCCNVWVNHMIWLQAR